MGYKWRRGRFPGRPRKERIIEDNFGVKKFVCLASQNREIEVYIYFDELEAMRLVDYEGLSQEDAGGKMNISRGTIWRLLEQGRKKILAALTSGKTIVIKPREEKNLLIQDEE
jgi:predicted DNA-binding protein (UPF0251 family)